MVELKPFRVRVMIRRAGLKLFRVRASNVIKVAWCLLNVQGRESFFVRQYSYYMDAHWPGDACVEWFSFLIRRTQDDWTEPKP